MHEVFSKRTRCYLNTSIVLEQAVFLAIFKLASLSKKVIVSIEHISM